MTSQVPATAGPSFSIRRLRTFILVALVVGCAVFTGVMFTLVQSLSERFGPQVQADLQWRALRGATELSRTTDLGLAVSDASMVKEAFGAHALSSDVQAIVAIDAAGKVVATHGQIDATDAIFAAKPSTLVNGPGYVASWAPAIIEGNQVGKVAMVVSTKRLADAQHVLSNVQMITLIAGIAGMILGALVILFFTRQVSLRDHQLNDYAHNLEQKVEARTRELDERNQGMRLVLDNVAQGFITIDLDGTMAAERSAVVGQWFGDIPAGMTFRALLAKYDAGVADWFGLGLESVRDGFMPPAVTLDQLPKRFTADGRTYEIKYSPIGTDDNVQRILLILSDITEHIISERAEREQRELVTLFQRITSDRPGFDEFLEEAGGLVQSLAKPGDPAIERRVVHTLKGNCAIYGFERFAELCHNIETELAEDAGPLLADQRMRLADAWHALMQQMAKLLGESRRNIIELDFAELARVVDKAKQGMPSRDLAVLLSAWTHEPISRRFERLAKHASSLARRLGKGEIEVEIADDGVRLDTSRWTAFWAAMIHAVRNAVDHGVETAEARASAGKLTPPKLTFAASRGRGRVMISLTDDGAGIDWEKVRSKAQAAGLPAETRGDLEQALFADGLSTNDQATDTSGRGVGMSALRDEVYALGGVLEIESERGKGTTLRFRFPEADGQILPLRPPTQPNLKLA